MKRTMPAWWTLAVVAAIGTLSMRSGSVSDVDVFWHVRVGDLLRSRITFPFPDPWAYTFPSRRWHSTAWLSEIVLSFTHSLAGWTGVVALRLVITSAFLVLLFRLLVAGSRDRAAPAVYALAVLPLASYVEERPQTVSLVFLVWLAGVLRALLEDGRAPHRWRTVAATYLWACLHGLFVLVPALLLLIGLVQLRVGRQSVGRRTMVTGLLSGGASAFTPMGPRLLAAPLTVGSAARGYITEWDPTNVEVFGALGFFVFLAIIAVCYARSSEPVPTEEIVLVLALGVFGLLAIRNAGPATVLLAPVALRRLRATWPSDSALTLPAVPAVAILLLGLLAVGGSYFTHPALTGKPAHIASYLGELPNRPRVLNDYNSSGYLIYRDGSRIRLAVDGRADRYGGSFLRRYSRAMAGDPGWQEFVDELSPQYAVLPDSSPLPELLRLARGWRVLMHDHHLVLLVAPSTA